MDHLRRYGPVCRESLPYPMAVRVQNFVSGTNALEKENALLIPSLAIDRQLRELAGKIQSATGLDSISLTEQETKLLMDALYESPYRLWGTRQAPGSNAVRSLMQGPWERGEVRHIRLKEGKGEVSVTAPEPPRGCEFSLRVPPASRLGFAHELRALAEKRLLIESQRLLKNKKPLVREKPDLGRQRERLGISERREGSEADNDRMHIEASNYTSGHISHALMNFNRALIEMAHDRSMVDVATQLDRGLNRLQNEWLFGQSDRSLGEVDQFQRMMLSEVQGERKQEFLSSSALASLVRLDPMVLNQKRLIDGGYTPGTELSADLQKSATKVHKKLRSAFSSVEAKGDKVVELAAELIYIVRSNIAHGEKTPFGDDIAKSARDESVCSATVPVQWLLTDILLNSPTNRLLVYGSLAPGENNHAIVANLQGSWQDCVVRGTLREKQGLRELIWNPTGGEVPAKLFESTDLKAHWERIDRFEGSRYRRQFVLVKTPTDVCVANTYVAA